MQKNIVYGEINAAGNISIGDKIYIVERDFPFSILFLRIEKSGVDYEAMLSVKSQDDTAINLFQQTVHLAVSDDLFQQAENFQNLRRNTDQHLRGAILWEASEEENEANLAEIIYQTFFSDGSDIGTVCRDFLELLQQNKTSELLLIISSEEESIQNLPWEMVLPALVVGGGYTLPKDSFGLIRTRQSNINGFSRQGVTTQAAPLKMLFIPALPENLSEQSKMLEIEDEQRKIIQAVSSLEVTGDQQPKLVMEILDCADLTEIRQAITARSHDIVHISGHGAYLKDLKQGILCLENEDGDLQQTTGHELGVALRQFSSIKLLVLAACETAVGGPEGSTAEQVAAIGIPAVIAMRFSVTDIGARLFTEKFYERLAYGDSLTKAMHDARQNLWTYVQQQRVIAPHASIPAEWFTPILYQNQFIGSVIKGGQYNNDSLSRFYPKMPFIKGIHTRLIGEGFIGRKRLLIQLRQAFKRGQHVCLHGLGGLGKTTTAEAFANEFRKRNGHDILIFRNGPQIQETIILEQIFEKWKYAVQPDRFAAQQLKALLDSPQINLHQKIQLLIDNCLAGRNNIILFDNFEDVQTEQDGLQQQAIVAESLRDFIRYFLQNVPSSCHILFTSRYHIADFNGLIYHLAVGKMTYAEEYRYINLSETLRKIPISEREILHRKIDGHPRALTFLEGLLHNGQHVDLARLVASISKVEVQIFEDLLLERIYSQLNSTEQEVFAVASVFFSRSPLSALSAIIKKEAGEMTSILVSLRGWSLCFWNEEQQFEVHALTRAWMQKEKLLDNSWLKQISYRIGVYFQGQKTWDDLFLAKVYFTQAEAWKEYEQVMHRLIVHHELVGLYSMARDLCQELLKRNVSPSTNANALSVLGQICFKQGNYDMALTYYDDFLKIILKIGDPTGVAVAYVNMGRVYISQGNISLAETNFKQSLSIAQRAREPELLGSVLNNLGLLYFDTIGDTNQALYYFKESLHFNRVAKDIGSQSLTLNLTV